MRILTQDRFYPRAKELRSHFESRFENPRGADAGRFVWDYWHVPEQYTLLRTPAYHFFPSPLYRDFHEKLVLWGRRTLGCHDISPPWLSCYVDGHRQEFHGDLPHGPWAFVYSLTPWETRQFLGGETQLLKSEVLEFWKNLDQHRGMEREDVIEEIEPKFNRLTVFDPRIPHGVKRVEGVYDPREGRLVIHGWFVQPRPFIEGPLKPRELQSRIDDLSSVLEGFFGSHSVDARGLISVRLEISPAGSVRSAKILCDTLVLAHGDPQGLAALKRLILKTIQAWKFARASKGSYVTLPLIFES